MNLALECKKMKRTWIFPMCLAGGILAAAVPILEFLVRAERYIGLMKPPLQTILEADWQMMSMFNVLLVVMAACMMYHTEYMDNAMQRMTTLPVREEHMFFGKAVVLSGMCAGILIVETLALIFCTLHWFRGEGGAYEAFYKGSFAGAYLEFTKDLLYNFCFCFCMLAPAVLLSLMVASMCRNMWISLGIDVVCVFAAIMIPAKSFALSVFPFALPFRSLEGTDVRQAARYLMAAVLEAAAIGAAELLFLKVRRKFA